LTPSPQPWPANRAIFLIDDDPFLAYARKSVLQRRFRDVERAADAAGAFIRLEEPGFAQRLALVIVALSQPGIAGPQFVEELSSRIARVPILVVGRAGEIALDYSGGEHVRFLPRHASAEDLLAGVCHMLALPQAA
jgi:CheY-like chemotaxis protein